MLFTPYNMENWQRSQLFYYFARIAPTGYSLTVDVDVTHLREAVRNRGLKFFPAYLYSVTSCICEQQELRTAIVDGKVGCFDYLTPLYAVFHEDTHTFSFMWTEYCSSFREFYSRYIDDATLYGKNKGLLAKEVAPPANAYTISCVPWVRFNHFAVHSYDKKDYFLPSVEAGRIAVVDGRELMPLSITAHHATTDGWHIDRLLQGLNHMIENADQWLDE